MSDAAIVLATPVRRELAPLEFTADQKKIIRDSFLSGATEEEAAALLEVARLRRLNPLTKQIHYVKRPTKRGDQWVDVWAFQVSIDGLRSISERTGLYDGHDPIETTFDDKGFPIESTIRMYRKDRSRPVVARALFREFAQFTRDGKLTKMWAEKPVLMLEKCVEALGHRKLFPEDSGDCYTADEFHRDEKEEPKAPAVLGASVQVAPALPVADRDAADKFVADLTTALEHAANPATVIDLGNKIAAAHTAGEITSEDRGALLKVWKTHKARTEKEAKAEAAAALATDEKAGLT